MRLEWSRRTDARPSVIPTANLFHMRLGYKIAVDLLPAPTAAGRSTVIWPTAMANSTAAWTATTAESAVQGVENTFPRETVAGAMLGIVVEARDAYGNSRGAGKPWFSGTSSRKLCFNSPYSQGASQHLNRQRDISKIRPILEQWTTMKRRFYAIPGPLFQSLRKPDSCPHLFLTILGRGWAATIQRCRTKSA